MAEFICTEKEKTAIDAVKEAVKNLPAGIYIETSPDNGCLEFWRRTPGGNSSAIMVGLLRCKSKLDTWL